MRQPCSGFLGLANRILGRYQKPAGAIHIGVNNLPARQRFQEGIVMHPAVGKAALAENSAVALLAAVPLLAALEPATFTLQIKAAEEIVPAQFTRQIRF